MSITLPQNHKQEETEKAVEVAKPSEAFPTVINEVPIALETPSKSLEETEITAITSDVIENEDITLEDDWYTVVKNAEQFEQGDLLDSFPIILPKLDNETKPNEYSADEKKVNVVILTQSCDLEKAEKDSNYDYPVLYARRYDLDKVSFKGKKIDNNSFGNLKKGGYVDQFLLNDCSIEGYENKMQVVDFTQVYSLPLSKFKNHLTKFDAFKRLKSPYKEQLGQHFGMKFMRIGLPHKWPKKLPTEYK